VRATELTVYAPSLGQARLAVLKNEHGNFEYLVTNDRAADLSQLVQRERRRWGIETVFRETKQVAGLGACQCWSIRPWSATSHSGSWPSSCFSRRAATRATP
jgi:hypothetical protein